MVLNGVTRKTLKRYGLRQFVRIVHHQGKFTNLSTGGLSYPSTPFYTVQLTTKTKGHFLVESLHHILSIGLETS